MLDCTDGYNDQSERHSDFHNPYHRYPKFTIFVQKSGGGEVKKVKALMFSKNCKSWGRGVELSKKSQKSANLKYVQKKCKS